MKKNIRQSRLKYVRSELQKKGFGDLPNINIRSNDPKATPVVFLTNCCIYPQKEEYVATPTKTYYQYAKTPHLFNVTGAVATRLIEKNIRIIMHVPSDAADRIIALYQAHPKSHLIHFIQGDIYSKEFLHTLYGAIGKVSADKPISRVDLCLYDSYASGLEKPFIPMFEENPATISQLADRRTHFLFNMAMMGYDLLVNRNQREFRLVCPTALATKRPSSHLFADAIHKVISNALLITLGYEMPYYTGEKVYIIEVAPGIVDTGLYDSQSIRDYTIQEAEMDGFPMRNNPHKNIHRFPMLSIGDLAEVTTAYLTAKKSEHIMRNVRPEIADLTLAGRKRKELASLFKKAITSRGGIISVNRVLPEYCYTPRTIWGALPDLKSGYIPVMLTPQGQYF